MQVAKTRKETKKAPGTATVAEAGRKGGLTTRDTYGREHFVALGRKGGRRLQRLIAAGKKLLDQR